MTAEAHRLVLKPVMRDGRHYHGGDGPMYSVTYNGAVIVASTRQPLLDGARGLAALGLGGDIELWDEVRPFPRMRSTVEAAAGLTVQENDKVSPRVGKYRPFVMRAEAA